MRVRLLDFERNAIVPLPPIYQGIARFTTVKRDQNNGVEHCTAVNDTDLPETRNYRELQFEFLPCEL